MSIPEPGADAAVSLTVASDDTAIALRSGDVAVLATPRVLALCEEAAVAAVASALDPEETTVGRRVELDHLAPTPVGTVVTAHALLRRVEGRTLVFGVVVTDGDRIVARARIDRVLVDRARFPG